MSKNDRLSILQATELACQYAPATNVIEVPVMEALDHILAEDLYTRIDQPPFPRSAMDGYAIHASDTKGASKEHPIVLPVVGCQYAGDSYFRSIEKGEVVRIMTGAAIPDGADAVIRQEDTDYGEDRVSIYVEVNEKNSYCEIGEDFPKGDLLAEKGDLVDAYLVAAAVAAGIDQVKICAPVHAAIITTGDELQMPGEPLREGKIYNSNLALFVSRLKQLGCVIDLAVAAGDDLEKITQLIEKASRTCQLILTTGGVSVGVKDLIPFAMEKMGAEVVFHGISIKPGMPTMFSVYDKIPVVSLSGNPYSAAAVFELLVQPLLIKMTGSRQEVLKKVRGIAKDHFPKKTGCDRFLRGYYEDGMISFGKGQRNGQTKAGIGTNCLIYLEAGREPVQKGEVLTAFML